MRKTHQNLSETHIVGAKTKQWIVRAEDCPSLGERQIAHVGVAHTFAPYQMVRTNLNGAYLLACFGGLGHILLDGKWQECKPGTACLAPPHVLHAFHALKESPWEFCWVKYLQPEEQEPIITAGSPVMAPFDPLPLREAIMGLYHEAAGVAEPVALRHWTELIHAYVLRFAQPWHADDRLARLWDMVKQEPGADWSLGRLAGECHLSEEHLRRLCRRHLGRSPMHHVTYLRMERAAQLLEQTTGKLETIAGMVGYQNPFVFSNTFKRWIGWRPSEYRRKRNTSMSKR